MVKLGVNIDQSATLRQARYRGVAPDSTIIVEPNPIEIALLAERGGADSITAHLREDRRHIVDDDIRNLRKKIATKLNLEMACSDDVLKVALEILPDYVCLVPENREEITTEGGLDLIQNKDKTARVVEALSAKGVICSIFIDPNPQQIEIAKEIGAPTIELHTGAYANAWGNDVQKKIELERLAKASEFAKSIGLTVNSGHGINYQNVGELLQVADFNELNIGHTIISRALYVGIEKAVAEMKSLLK
ncbi:MAG: pyridoxine 5'-phosphate synthase [Opitutales bacterium]|nr:pyridoxine 5'-phosphate synthase [Opitutales bacterium]